MKPANFPGRKNDRRKRAMARMLGAPGLYDDDTRAVTAARIVPDSTARAVRTKKDRSAQARLRA